MGSNRHGSGGEPESPKSDRLARQISMYNLTLDEIQHQLGELGKPLINMNLDELLKSVWTVDNSINLHHHTLDLRKRTVNDIWQDIQQCQKTSDDITNQQPTLGKMTLENFLIKAGIIVEKVDSNVSHQYSMQFQVPLIDRQQDVYMGYPESHMATTTSPLRLMHDLSDTMTPGRKRVASGDVVEKTVERRHKRMIKNRESAARSRARKQAYTNELENKISRLEEENERLKRQKEAGKVLPSAPTPKLKHRLPRTSSAPF